MDDDGGVPEEAAEAEPAAAAARPRSRRLWLALGLVGLLVVVGGFLLGRGLWWSLRPTPEFESLAERPDPTLRGTVAFLRSSEDGAGDCIFLVAAAGGDPWRLTCIDGGAGRLSLDPPTGGLSRVDR